MSLGALMEEKRRATTSSSSSSSSQVHMSNDIDWQMLDKSRFFILGAALFSGVSTALYPIVVLKTRQQVSPTRVSCANISLAIARFEGLRGFYKGFGTSLLGTIPARALYMTALEITKSSVGQATVRLGLSDTTALAVANGAAGLTSAVAAQVVWTPIDVVSQRLMVQGDLSLSKHLPGVMNSCRYRNGFDAFRKILYTDGPRGFYRGFGISILTYAPSNAVWWASYSLAQKSIWSRYKHSQDHKKDAGGSVVVQALSAATASGCSALVTMPVHTIKTRLQVLDTEENGRRRAMTVMQSVKSLMKEGGFGACYRGLGPRWVSMSMSATTMITTYEFLKRLATKKQK
ncbi:Mitochondrial substrate/solute carrier [Arabidopsis thaliana x Arabidopsis arenosa]|uniref:Mitochondrial substrate/solute carrier n=1 Tax=Arabidopsis thaliana x Arabidopsis arenosa TaxID=1240361 RepID=A0A8T1YZI9_9BRAS|nr:Mitochondrial substrate/solute carrier [Arabidopsis thaliana x Arabidopsis arenosa]